MDHTNGTRRIGIAGVDKVAWGEHVCVFFETKEDLLNLCVPFIKAGLEDNEFCMWITGEPVTEQPAFEALHYGYSPRKIGPNLVPTSKLYMKPFAMSGLLPCALIR